MNTEEVARVTQQLQGLSDEGADTSEELYYDPDLMRFVTRPRPNSVRTSSAQDPFFIHL